MAPDRLSAATAAALARPVQTRAETLRRDVAWRTRSAATRGQRSPHRSAPRPTYRKCLPPVQVAPRRRIPAPPLWRTSVPYTAFLVLLGSPLIGLAYFLLFPFVAIAIAVAVLGKEIAKVIGGTKKAG